MLWPAKSQSMRKSKVWSEDMPQLRGTWRWWHTLCRTRYLGRRRRSLETSKKLVSGVVCSAEQIGLLDRTHRCLATAICCMQPHIGKYKTLEEGWWHLGVLCLQPSKLTCSAHRKCLVWLSNIPKKKIYAQASFMPRSIT